MGRTTAATGSHGLSQGIPLGIPLVVTLLLGVSLPSGHALWSCPTGTVASSVTVKNDSWTSVTSYFTGKVTADTATSLADCLASAKTEACVNLAPKGVLLYSTTTLATNPATFEKSNCLYGTACNSAAAAGTTAAQALSFTCKYSPPPRPPRPPPPPPGGCLPPTFRTQNACSCPFWATCARRARCGVNKFVCSCLRARKQEVRSKKTLALLECRVQPAGQPGVIYV